MQVVVTLLWLGGLLERTAAEATVEDLYRAQNSSHTQQRASASELHPSALFRCTHGPLQKWCAKTRCCRPDSHSSCARVLKDLCSRILRQQAPNRRQQEPTRRHQVRITSAAALNGTRVPLPGRGTAAGVTNRTTVHLMRPGYVAARPKRSHTRAPQAAPEKVADSKCCSPPSPPPPTPTREQHTARVGHPKGRSWKKAGAPGKERSKSPPPRAQSPPPPPPRTKPLPPPPPSAPPFTFPDDGEERKELEARGSWQRWLIRQDEWADWRGSLLLSAVLVGLVCISYAKAS
eukprot:4695647-Prymnesium_polylepis.1